MSEFIVTAYTPFDPQKVLDAFPKDHPEVTEATAFLKQVIDGEYQKGGIRAFSVSLDDCCDLIFKITPTQENYSRAVGTRAVRNFVVSAPDELKEQLAMSIQGGAAAFKKILCGY
ncbi:MAG: hypothetical protein A2341_23330 [Deltaproteobacteria bacterium RIFOXYB12_FULL_58_9]|nr:MAG: hypothetical protein A2341_23330 [Deltaproteobacteria bacterium RIFOXYB12_FULL_58_9]